MDNLGIYVHIPFCLSKCPYCDFYSVKLNKITAQNYVQSLLRAISFSKNICGEKKVDSIYFGGGTPVVLGTELVKVLCGLKNNFNLAEDCEITLESNPAAVTFPVLSQLRESGFNRISIGVQAADDAELKRLGRLHNLAQAVESVQIASEAGFQNISVDLMLGTPGQKKESIDKFAEIFSALPVRHISGYLLQVEEGTVFAKRHIESLCPGEDEAAQLYFHAVDLLEKLGFMQYEISNFAKSGYKSRHNLKYWKSDDYLGIGPAAHSFLGGKRFFFPRDLSGFISAENPFSLAKEDGSGGDFFEYVMLRLRLKEGLYLPDLAEKFPEENLDLLIAKAKILEKQNLLEYSQEKISLSTKGFLISNSVILYLLDLN